MLMLLVELLIATIFLPFNYRCILSDKERDIGCNQLSTLLEVCGYNSLSENQKRILNSVNDMACCNKSVIPFNRADSILRCCNGTTLYNATDNVKCLNNEIVPVNYELCNGFIYNPSEHCCSTKDQILIKKRDCNECLFINNLSNYIYNGKTEMCCNDTVVKVDEPSNYTCCNNKPQSLINKQGKFKNYCCNNQVLIDTDTDVCCQGKPMKHYGNLWLAYRQNYLKCHRFKLCGNTTRYDSTRSVCCDGKIHRGLLPCKLKM